MLQLDYAFLPSPNPIQCSVPGANPSRVDLQVMISNPHSDPVTMRRITLEIPVGEDSAADLSDAPHLPQPAFDSTIPWTITVSASEVLIEPVGDTGRLTSSIVFHLPGIAVNQTAGTVPVVVTEYAPGVPKVVDATHSLTKWPAQFPVTDFWPEPAVLTDLDQTVTLSWTCSDQGRTKVYSLHSDSWQPDQCLSGGSCFHCSEGAAGITTPPLGASTTFSLDVIGTNPSGERVIEATISTRVRASIPSISSNSYLTQHLASGRVALLHWLAFDAAVCSVSIDGRTVDSRAPADTYVEGYPLVLNEPPGQHQVVVVAHAEQGSAVATLTFPLLTVGASPTTILPGLWADSVAVIPSKRMAVVANPYWYNQRNVIAVDLATRQLGPRVPTSTQQVSTVGQRSGIAITPDGQLALVANAVTGSVAVVDLPGGPAGAEGVPGVDSNYTPIAVSPDGSIALVGGGGGVNVIDVAGRQLKGPPIVLGDAARGIAFTPDGTRALVAAGNVGLVVIDVGNSAVESTLSFPGATVTAVAVAPDGKLALVGRYDGSLSVVDLAGPTVEPLTIPVQQGTAAIAFAEQGTLALVACMFGGVTVVDVAARRSSTEPFPVNGTNDIAVAVDGTVVAVGYSSDMAAVVMII